MTVSRTQFLKLCGGTLIAAHLDPASLIANAEGIAPAGATLVTGPSLQAGGGCAAQFRQHLQSMFVVGSADTRSRVLLADVIERSNEPQLEQFSLVFHTVDNAALSEGSHPFHHPVLGHFDLYIAPIGTSTNRHAIFEACFSWHANPAAPAVPRTARRTRNPHGV